VFTPDKRTEPAEDSAEDSEGESAEESVAESTSKTLFVTDQDGECYEAETVGATMSRGANTIADSVYTKRCASVMVIKFDNSDKIATGFFVELSGRKCVMTNHHVLRNAEDAMHAYAYFDFEVEGAGTGAQTPKQLLFDPEKSSGKLSRTDSSKKAESAKLFVRMYRPLDVTICQFASQTAVNYKRYPSMVPFNLDSVVVPSPGDMIRIVQHPDGAPKCLSEGKVLRVLDLDDKIELTEGGLPAPGNVQYDAQTLPGSSGSPIFDGTDDWNFIGIHHCNVDGNVNGGTSVTAVLHELDCLSKRPASGAFEGLQTVPQDCTREGEKLHFDTPASWMWDGTFDNLPEDKGYDDVAIQFKAAKKTGKTKNKKAGKKTIGRGGAKKDLDPFG